MFADRGPIGKAAKKNLKRKAARQRAALAAGATAKTKVMYDSGVDGIDVCSRVYYYL